MLKEVNSTEFKDLAGKGLVLADFFSTTCGPCKMLGFVLKDVEKEFDLRPSTATGLLGALEKKGLIQRISNTQDGRYKILHPTEKAQNIRGELAEEIRKKEAALTKGIPKQELEQFKQTAEKMLRNLE